MLQLPTFLLPVQREERKPKVTLRLLHQNLPREARVRRGMRRKAIRLQRLEERARMMLELKLRMQEKPRLLLVVARRKSVVAATTLATRARQKWQRSGGNPHQRRAGRMWSLERVQKRRGSPWRKGLMRQNERREGRKEGKRALRIRKLQGKTSRSPQEAEKRQRPKRLCRRQKLLKSLQGPKMKHQQRRLLLLLLLLHLLQPLRVMELPPKRRSWLLFLPPPMRQLMVQLREAPR
jgi:hypothetical protein